MHARKIIIGLIISILLSNTAFSDSSTNYTIDVSTLNSGGSIASSPNYKVNDTIVGFVDGYTIASANYSLGSGLVYLELWCGNGILEFGEACDDGNTTSWDGCSSVCQTEVIVCGNGVLEIGEQCDDGNTISGDGCSSTCQTEIVIACGNGVLEIGEQCDDGNNISGDGCSALCVTEVPPGGGVTGGSTTGGWNFCGNGIFNTGEECDDGNNISGDGCSATCDLEEVPPEEVPPEEIPPEEIPPEEIPPEEIPPEEIPPEERILRTIKIKARPEKRVNPEQNWATQAKMVFYNKTLQKTILTTYVNINDLGWGLINTDRLPEGDYDISLKGLSHLTKVLRNTPINSEAHTLDFTFRESFYLTAGDVHETKDDFINGLDISATVNRLYNSNVHADLNRDGIVNGLDLSIVVSNLYRSGERL